MKLIYTILLAVGFFTSLSCSQTATESEQENDQADTTDTAITEDKTENTEAEVPVEKNITYGIDISKYQGNEIDLMVKAQDSLDFIICRSTEGITYTDPKFQSNWASIKEKGFIRGAYHFYRSDDDPDAQAKNFMNAVGTFEPGDFPPIIDFEELSIAKGSNKEKVIEDLWKFIFIIEEKTGRMPIIYSDENIANSYLTALRFSNYPLWIANYSSKESPEMPGAWKGTEWQLWQRSDNYMIGSIQNDFDLFNGGISELKAFIEKSKMKKE